MRIYIWQTDKGNDYSEIIDTNICEINHYGDTISFIYKDEKNQMKSEIYKTEKIWDVCICNLEEK